MANESKCGREGEEGGREGGKEGGKKGGGGIGYKKERLERGIRWERNNRIQNEKDKEERKQCMGTGEGMEGERGRKKKDE